MQHALNKQGEKYEFAIDFYDDTSEEAPPPTPPVISPRYVPKIRYYSDKVPLDSDKFINYPVK
jgi:hypothetical protein